ncbi:MAG: endonuclease III [Candidatus Moraniibacteriota bacterium]|nr:MAG: endonuclease III [Candidatus Moranbacteria bacterium]
MMIKKDRAKEILRRLEETYAKPGPFVEWSTPLELVVGTVLSAQCTDERVNRVTKVLFAKYRTAQDYALADSTELERDIYQTGFYKSKAKYLRGIGTLLVEKFGGEVPDDFEALLTFPGVARKTAHIVMAKAFGKFTGVAVDTHVMRMAPRLGLTKEKEQEKIAKDLEKLFPREEYLHVNEYLITHGRAVCVPRKPKCAECVLRDICPALL